MCGPQAGDQRATRDMPPPASPAKTHSSDGSPRGLPDFGAQPPHEAAKSPSDRGSPTGEHPRRSACIAVDAASWVVATCLVVARRCGQRTTGVQQPAITGPSAAAVARDWQRLGEPVSRPAEVPGRCTRASQGGGPRVCGGLHEWPAARGHASPASALDSTPLGPRSVLRRTADASTAPGGAVSARPCSCRSPS